MESLKMAKQIDFQTLRVDHSLNYSKTMLPTKITYSLLAKVDCIKLETESSKF